VGGPGGQCAGSSETPWWAQAAALDKAVKGGVGAGAPTKKEAS